MSPVGAVDGRRESLSPCLLVVWFASLGLLVWVELVPGWAPCPHPVSGRGPSSLVLGRGGYEDVVFCGSFVRWFGRDMFRDVLIGPLWAYVSPSSEGVLLGPADRAYVSFCRRLVGWRAFRFAFVVVTHPCCWSVFLVYRVYVVCASPFLLRQRVVRGTFG